MIHVNKIIYIHEEGCKDVRVKKLDSFYYHAVDVSLTFYTSEELEEWRNNLKEVTGFKNIDFRYISIDEISITTPNIIEDKHEEVSYISENREHIIK